MNVVEIQIRIEHLLRESGPQTGAQLQEKIPGDPLVLWKACKTAANLVVRPLDKRFLRLDRSVEGYARLSPSIRREFLTYSVVGLREQEDLAVQALEGICRRCEAISERKMRLAESAMASCLDEFKGRSDLSEHVCCILAGDIVYGLAHDVPRPERSTGQLVRGSDLDVVIITSDELDPDWVRRLDDQILKKKHYLLVHPDFREEMDYILKPLARVREQVRFDTFEHMVACKILHEGRYLLGRQELLNTVKQLLENYGIPGKLEAMQQTAMAERTAAETHLLSVPESEARQKYLHLFYTREESEEIY